MNVLENARLVVQAAKDFGAPSSLAMASLALCEKAAEVGLGEMDIVALADIMGER